MSKKLKGLAILVLMAVLCIGVLAADIYYDYIQVQVTDYSIVSNKITSAEDGAKLAIIADYHSAANSDKIIKRTQEEDPDAIIVAGDLINMNDSDFSNAESLIKELKDIAPVYFTSGNHERWLIFGEDEFLKRIEECGATILNMKVMEVPVKDGSIVVSGYQDMIYSDDDVRVEYLNSKLDGLYSKINDEQREKFNLLVFHRGNLLEYAARNPYDLIVSGHLHGGQVNLPWIRNKILEERVGTSEFVKGYYEVNGVKAIISGGLENTDPIKRVFNTPEIVVITLNSLQN